MIVLLKKSSYWWLILAIVVAAIWGLVVSADMKAHTSSDAWSGSAIQADSIRDKDVTTNDLRKPEEQKEEHKQAVAELEKLGGVVTVKTSEDGQIYSEVKLLGPRYQREWKGDGEGIRHLKELLNLKGLRIQDIEKFSDEGMAYLKDIKSLESLILVRTQVTDDGLAYLKNLTNLEFLGLWSISNLPIRRLTT